MLSRHVGARDVHGGRAGRLEHPQRAPRAGHLHVSDPDEDAGDPKTQSKATPPNATKGADAPKPPTLTERADRLERALNSQTTLDGVTKALALAAGLRADLDDKLPERSAEIEALGEALLNKFALPPKDDFGIGEDEIPF